MSDRDPTGIPDTGERMLPVGERETSVVFARHKFTYEYCKAYAQGKNVLDVGCGTGYGSRILAECATSVLGIDRDPAAIAYCRAHQTAPNLSYAVGDATRLTFDRQFDVCLSFQVIEHLENPRAFLEELRRFTVPDGRVLLTTPNSLVGLEGKPDNPFHISEMTYEQFRDLVASVFTTWEIVGIGYATKSRLRQLVFDSPLYAVGRKLRRRSRVKKFASGVLGLSSFRIVRDPVARDSIDLLAVCSNNRW